MKTTIVGAGALLIAAFAAGCQAAGPAPSPTPTATIAPGGTPSHLPTPTPQKATPIPIDTPNPAALEGGILATFDVTGELFRIWVTNEVTIEKMLALKRGESTAAIPNGRILRGSGQAAHNAPWNWHLDPDDIDMADLTIEVCDGRPSYVEGNVEEFVDTVKRYCPWSARLVDVEDFRR